MKRCTRAWTTALLVGAVMAVGAPVAGAVEVAPTAGSLVRADELDLVEDALEEITEPLDDSDRVVRRLRELEAAAGN
ncbi:hypothetical protein [Streptomyces sp. AK02-01A]|uniref:hypothetical protein n=1 Tax=Streptomyces sp. AK02-01A TaxID=3028648 RepID=UPI0029B6DC43|nr:hypothetical protein [Streptomyces sp. AK02-01A]MDX3853035.1 hypothetical protein [Streptomyces sp. AK02-01A]